MKKKTKAKKSVQWLYDMQNRIVGFEERVVMSYKDAEKIWGKHPQFPKNILSANSRKS